MKLRSLKLYTSQSDKACERGCKGIGSCLRRRSIGASIAGFPTYKSSRV
jgi:hypothetical protein